jgi:hypothetical protein
MDAGERLVPLSPGGGPPLMEVATGSGLAVGLPAVGEDRGALLDVIGEERAQRAGRGVGHHRHPAAPQTSGGRRSTAMPISSFLPLARPPRSPGSSPPM